MTRRASACRTAISACGIARCGIFLLVVASCQPRASGTASPQQQAPGATFAPDAAALARINHIVVIYLENRSFDNLYGEFEGAEGLKAARSAPRQVDERGAPYLTLPQAQGTPFPRDLPNAPFEISRFLPPTVPTRDLVHRFYQEQAQIHGGRMDRFALVSDAEGLTMGYYHTSDLPLAALAHEFTLCDRFFHSAFGGSFLNHQWMIAARTPEFFNAPAAIRALLQSGSALPSRDGAVTPDGYVVNTAYSVHGPHPVVPNTNELMPPQTHATIGDRLDERGLSWAWYAGGWSAADAGTPTEDFQFHHQPFVYFAKFAEGSDGRREHLKDESAFVEAVHAGSLPAVAFVKPVGFDNEHPGYADVIRGERHVLALINDIRKGPNWHDTAIIVTYDENGGLWDHVAPPKGDRWGPGTRVATMVISPFARRGYVDHTTYETVSILALIEKRWGLAPLTDRDARATPLLGPLDLSTARSPGGEIR